MKIKIFALLFLATFSMHAQKGKKAAPAKKPAAANQAKPAQSNDGLFVEFETAKGKILVRLEYQKAPITVANFVALAEGKQTFVADEKLKGKPFYDGLKFHRVIKDFMIQGGDPAGNGSGGPGYSFKDEIVPGFVFDKAGILAMANSGPATNGSQFFITHKDTPWLNGKHTIFGYVVTGQNVVDAIAQDDVMKKVTIIRKGAAAKAFDAVKVYGDYYANKAEDDKKQAEKEENDRIKADEIALKEFVNGRTTESGLKYIILNEGTGSIPTSTSNVKVHYTGYFTNGKIFDSSVQRGTPAEFGLNQVIKGWTEALQLMKEGAKYKFYIPYNLAYGDRGYPGAIPPKSNLIFEIELIKINQ